jgi:hypothetical protein
MQLLRIALVASLILGCEASDKTAPDADPAAPVCTGLVYDNCSTGAQCMNGMECHLFSGEFQVCTTTCTAGDNSTCPPSLGGTPKCNNRGICKPALNNMCKPPG